MKTLREQPKAFKNLKELNLSYYPKLSRSDILNNYSDNDMYNSSEYSDNDNNNNNDDNDTVITYNVDNDNDDNNNNNNIIY